MAVARASSAVTEGGGHAPGTGWGSGGGGAGVGMPASEPGCSRFEAGLIGGFDVGVQGFDLGVRLFALMKMAS